MKKIYFSIAFGVAAILSASCSNTEEIKGAEPQISNAPIIYATQETSTKSSITVDGEGVGTIYWSPADDISIFYGASTPVLYTSTNIAPETTAAFTTSAIIGSTELASTNIWGLYPHDPSAICDGSSITTTLPSTQYGVAGTFDDDLYLTVAHSDNTNLHFFNVCGGIKFSLSRDDITSITFCGNNNEDIAGDLSINFVTDVPNVSIISGEKSIILTPKAGDTFASGVYYYIITTPAALSGGFTMTFETESQLGTFEYTSKAVSLKRSVFSKKDNIDEFATFNPKPYSTLRYTSSDGNTVTPYSISAFDATIVSNEYDAGQGIIVFDDILTTVGNYAFFGCTLLESITIPDDVASIGVYAFYNCGLKSITIPGSVETIKAQAFVDCTSLQTVTLSSGVSSIGPSVFEGCTGLETISIPATVSSIGNQAFDGCSSLQAVTIPNGVTKIWFETFLGCSSLETVTIPATVTSIGGAAFWNCTSLESVTLLPTTPPSLESASAKTFPDGIPLYVPAESVSDYRSALYWSDYGERIQAMP